MYHYIIRFYVFFYYMEKSDPYLSVILKTL